MTVPVTERSALAGRCDPLRRATALLTFVPIAMHSLSLLLRR